ncbi:MAG TPA: FkbM family methyltransferase [Caldilineaceae bacterium]|nr:FkbM family methyltransferase [Caldilineaceae bacterium]
MHSLQTRVVRWAYRHSRLFKWLIPIRRPVLLRLADFRLYVCLDDWGVGGRIAVKRTYEAHVSTLFRSLLEPGAVVVDIGANIGYYTLLAATRVGPTGKVIAFEPKEENCDLLRRSLAANDLHNVVVHCCAVAESDGVAGYYSSSSNGSISNDLTRPGARQVPTVALDDVLAGEPRIDVIKMDIEGAEGRAFQGMQGVLRRSRPILFSEFSPYSLPKNSGISGDDYLTLLRAAGYELYAITPTGGRSATPQTNAALMAHFTPSSHLDHIDLLALPQERAPLQ